MEAFIGGVCRKANNFHVENEKNVCHSNPKKKERHFHFEGKTGGHKRRGEMNG